MSDICRNEEWLAAYLDKRLSAQERDLFETHLTHCPSCLAELIAAKTELDEMSAEEPGAPAARMCSEARRRNETDPQSFLRRAFWFAPPSLLRRIRFTPRTAALSLAAAVICAGAFFLSIRSAVRDREIESARGSVSRILATADIGRMRLSGGPDRPVSHGVVYRDAGERAGGSFGRMEKSLKAALARRGNDWRLFALLGGLYMADNQIERAETSFEQALARKPGDARLLNDLAAAAYRLGKFDLSRRGLESALAADSTRIEALYNLAVLYRETGDRANSKRYIELYLRKDPSSPWAERAKDLNRE
ncbi:MAG: zf-HC2 domain-containing protein [Candidatus Krumholzibacteria bacterium]|nr:zf-HC2 domain-containing protein [Candidatus Krumholzibacteria bacterium]